MTPFRIRQPARLAALLLTLLPLTFIYSAVNAAACASVDNALQLPSGFCATVFADHIGHARHLAVAPDGTVFVNTWSGPYYGPGPVHPGGFLVALKAAGQDKSKASIIERFGSTADGGGTGGTGIAVYAGYVYAEADGTIVRYPLSKNAISPGSRPAVVLSGLPLDGDHPMHPFVIDAHGNLYVDLASATNSCQVKNRTLGSPGLAPCQELETRGGIWRYNALKLGQTFGPAQRFATGLRNAEGMALVGDTIFATVHGRDQLHSAWPSLYQVEDEATQPAEELVMLKQGSDFGWPECYFDVRQDRLVLAPEYGGDGGKKLGDCASKSVPLSIYPAHWAPTDAVYYDNAAFPAQYRHGIFIAFHGSWNRAPYEQDGYNVVFQSISSGDAARCEIFADGFAGPVKSPEKAVHRPLGLAVAPDGALFVADDVTGRIYRITHSGGVPTPGRACPNTTTPARPIIATTQAQTPSSTPDGRPAMLTPPGSTPEQVALGNRLYHGEIAGATCRGCHGADAEGSALAPSLTANEWRWSDGSLEGITKTIIAGVSQPKSYRAPMPAMGGAQLTEDQAAAIGAYVWAVSHQGAPKEDPSATGKQILIPGDKVFPESITSTNDGRLFIGSIGERAIYKADPGSMLASIWVTPTTGPALDPRMGVFGVLADDSRDTLWACFSVPPGPKAGTTPQARLRRFVLHSGAYQTEYPLPTPNAFCNDIAVGSDGAVYATDSANMQVAVLKPHAKHLSPWAGDGAFGPPDAVIDGIAIVGQQVIVNTLMTGKLFKVAILADGQAGAVSEVPLSRTLDHPDGMRADGHNGLLVVEGGGLGHLIRVSFSLNGSAVIAILKEGFPDGAVAVTQTGSTAYVLEGQLARLMKPNPDRPVKPFHASAVQLTDP